MKILLGVLTAGLLLVVLAIVLAIPHISSSVLRGKALQSLNNAKEIHFATIRMAMDNEAAPDPALGWPGVETPDSILKM